MYFKHCFKALMKFVCLLRVWYLWSGVTMLMLWFCGCANFDAWGLWVFQFFCFHSLWMCWIWTMFTLMLMFWTMFAKLVNFAKDILHFLGLAWVSLFFYSLGCCVFHSIAEHLVLIYLCFGLSSTTGSTSKRYINFGCLFAYKCFICL